MDYLAFVKNCADPETLALKTAEFLQLHIPGSSFVLLKHTPCIAPFTLLVKQNRSFHFERWQKSLAHKKMSAQSAGPVFEEGLYYFFSDANYEYEVFFFFLFPEEPGKAIQDILQQWNHCASLITASVLQAAEQNSITQGALIGQLLHDINSIIALQESEEISPDIMRRIEYQKKVNEDLLFFIRPPELMPFSVPVKQLIESSLQLTEIQKDIFSLTFLADPADITIDVELFSKAFNEIIWNSVQASEATLSKISITVARIASGSPFITHDWLEITVSDAGNGISADYLSHIWEPFFTTRKGDGHSGFGLTNAKKIIHALKGYMQLRSVKGKGTEVKLFLPIL